MYDVRATNGNTRLGGAKFVDRLMQYFSENLEGGPVDMDSFNSMEVSVIRAACEKAKKELSTMEKTEIVVSEHR